MSFTDPFRRDCFNSRETAHHPCPSSASYTFSAPSFVMLPEPWGIILMFDYLFSPSGWEEQWPMGLNKNVWRQMDRHIIPTQQNGTGCFPPGAYNTSHSPPLLQMFFLVYSNKRGFSPDDQAPGPVRKLLVVSTTAKLLMYQQARFACGLGIRPQLNSIVGDSTFLAICIAPFCCGILL